MAGGRRLLCRMLRTVPTRVSRGVGQGGRVVLRDNGSCKPHLDHLRSRHDRKLTDETAWADTTRRKGERDIPKRRTRPLRLALVRARPMCVPGLRPPAVSWVHDCESQTKDRPIIALTADLVLWCCSRPFTVVERLCAVLCRPISPTVCAWQRATFLKDGRLAQHACLERHHRRGSNVVVDSELPE